MSPSWSRRRFLGGLGASLTLAATLRRLEGKAHARDERVKRLVVVHSPNGTIHHQRRPTGSGTSFAFPQGSILEPLAHLSEHLVVIDGLDFHGATNHEGGMAAMLTGMGSATDPGGGRSIDQFVADTLGRDTPFRSLELGVQTSAWGSSVQTRMCYAGSGQRVEPDDDPSRVLQRLFGQADDAAARELLRRRREQLFGLAKGDLDRLAAVLPTAERTKIETHARNLQELTERVITRNACSTPTVVSADNIADHGVFGVITEQQISLLTAALACDLTRVASLQLAHTVAPHVLTESGVRDGHHTLSHAADGDSAGVEGFVQAERWLTGQVAHLIETLAATDDPVAGGKLLDHTLVVWAKEMGDSRMHVCEDVPFVLAGSLAGDLETGRYLRYNGESHEELLTGVCDLLGVATTGFGAHGRRTLPGLV